MNRINAVLAVGVGLAMVGVALGLLYMDVRDHAALQLAVESKMADVKESAAAIQQWQKHSRVPMAMLAGAVGAAFVGMGLMIAGFELRAFRRDSMPR